MISIIGAGPSGCYAAYLLSKAGLKTQIFEDHKEIGNPVQCTGLVTSSIKDIIKIKNSAIINKINKVRICSKDKTLELNLKNSNLILDRKKFDNDIADMAIKNGTKIFLNYKFIGNKHNSIKLRYNHSKEAIVKTDYIIGADGPLSQVARSNNLFGKRKFMTGLQIRAKLKNDNAIEFYPSAGSFSWIVPENSETCRIGTASYDNPKLYLEKLLKQKNITKKNIIETQGGLIPIYDPKLNIQKNNIYLIGDAATQVKATTGGGIIQGLKAATSLKNSIINNKDYQTLCKKELGKDLYLHLKMKKIMDKFKEKDWNLLLHLFSNKETKNTIEQFDRDYPSRFLIKLALKEPRLLYFLKFLF
ncbi:MAG: NAD(P)/FAD-dependent oxidoreductase [Nanoarchaeota archaeon]|nr:NAD(P)/FAD-dependent oxidoreductase [Nanoarchaeota archaeon]